MWVHSGSCSSVSLTDVLSQKFVERLYIVNLESVIIKTTPYALLLILWNIAEMKLNEYGLLRDR